MSCIYKEGCDFLNAGTKSDHILLFSWELWSNSKFRTNVLTAKLLGCNS